MVAARIRIGDRLIQFSKDARPVEDMPPPIRAGFDFIEAILARNALLRVGYVELIAEPDLVRVMIVFEPRHGAAKHHNCKEQGCNGHDGERSHM
jgi:hypothetical protein